MIGRPERIFTGLELLKTFLPSRYLKELLRANVFELMLKSSQILMFLMNPFQDAELKGSVKTKDIH